MFLICLDGLGVLEWDKMDIKAILVDPIVYVSSVRLLIV